MHTHVDFSMFSDCSLKEMQNQTKRIKMLSPRLYIINGYSPLQSEIRGHLEGNTR